MSLVCESCGHHNSGAALFCEGCGLPLPESQAAGSLIGRQIQGTYELVQLLGKGGMSVVYLARHMLTEQEVAVKVLPPELASQIELKKRFLLEASTMARLEHPNIVLMHNFIEEEGHLYLVMQYAEGETFDAIIDRAGRVDLAEAVDVGIQVLRALEYAHEQGVIHRDIKPSNFIVRGDGTVKVMDFGLAKFIGSAKLTQTGLTMGTVRYMSPEQVRGKNVDHRTDIYSLGATLYEAITGQTPFDGETHFQIMEKHLHAPPLPPSQLVEMPKELDAAVLKALAKRVEDRFQTARDFRHALQRVPIRAARGTGSEAALAHSPSNEPLPEVYTAKVVPGRRRINALAFAVASLLLLLAAGAVVWALYAPESSAPRAEGDVPVRRDGPSARAARQWPELHRVARSLRWKVDRTYGAPVQLRVLSTKALDPEAIRGLYRRARAAYPRYLRDEGVDLEFAVGPLNLCVVGQEVLNSSKDWPDVKPNTDYPVRYEAKKATLYVNDSKGFEQTDLPYGLALHFCALIAQLSDARCSELAEGFERYLRRTE